ncbi:MAG TPA: FimV/HubP family polar landmark protein [Candidatus Competibacteraceae bacterium]|nr:FimV/HubP family polar landmark protein [Candidatus Competibacteraceae bacterium]
MPTRILLRLFLLAGLAAPFCAFALGVGSLQVRSALNQNFNADIPLIVNNPAELIGLAVRIPRQQEFDQVGVERLELMSNLRFAVQTSPGGPNFIKVTSVQPIREPNFDLLLEVVWPRGRLLRTFPVQLDPELYTHRQEPPPPLQPIEVPLVEAPPIAPAPAASGLPPAPPVSFEGASFYGPVRPGENLTRIANQVRPAGTISVPDMMAILVAGNPEAFINGNPNLLRVGAVLKVPTPNALGVQGAPVPEPAMQAVAAPAPADSTLGPPTPPALPESLASQPPEITTPPESFTPPVSQTPEIATPPVSESPGITSPAPHEEMLKPVTPSSVQGTSPTFAESAPSAPLTPIAPQEIIPQTVMPQAEAPSGPDVVKPSPPPVVQEAAKPIVEPKPLSAPASAPKASPPPQETGMEWLSNPVVWIAITLIILAVASVLLVPLLRRPARPKKAAAEPKEEFAPESSGEEASEVVAGTQAQIRKPRPQKQPFSIPAKENATAAPASSVESAPKPGVVPPPKPIDELLKDIDFGLGDEKSRAMPPDQKKDVMPARDLEGRRLPDTEPPTASVTRTPDLPLASAISPDEPGAQTPVPQPPASKPAAPIQSSVPKPIAEQSPLEPLSELPSGLKLDSLDFDLGDLGLSTSREQPAELPPLELKPVEPSRTAADRKPLFDLPEIEPPTHPGLAREPSNPKGSDLKFEFTDVNQEYEKLDANEDLAKLDEELLNFGDADLGKMELSPLSTTAETGTDYVETKLDLASAYLDMGDQMGARGLLEDVLREGDASQKKRAEDMLKKVG